MHALKVIATDLDGTLLGPGGTFTARTAAALAAARERGIAVVAATARPPRVFQEWTALARHLDAAICSNGAIAYDPAAQTADTVGPMAPDTALAAAAALRGALPALRFSVETGFGEIAEPGYAHVCSVGDVRVHAGSLAQALAQAPQVVKLLAHLAGADADTVLGAARALDLPGVSLSHSGGSGLLEIGPAGVGKAGALASWCAARGVGPEAVAAFGDSPVDVPMLSWAGRSFAVANAHPEAAAAATDRCGANTEDGVAAAVEALLR